MSVFGVLLAVAGGVGLVLQLRGAQREARRDVEPAVLVVAVHLGLLIVAAASPPTFRAWMQEDWPVEWATVAAFGAAAVLSVTRALRKDSSGWLRLGWLAAALAWVFVAGEEMSWGQRVLGFATPEGWLEHNIQLEANLHNAMPPLTLGGVVVDSAFLAAVLALGLGAIGPAGIALLSRRWPEARSLVPLVASGPLRSALVVVAGLQWADLADFATEVTELVLGLTAVFISLRPVARRGWPSAALLVVLGAGTLLSMALRPVDDDPTRVDEAKQELLLLAGDLRQEAAPLLSAVATLRHRTFHARVQWTFTRLGFTLPDSARFSQVDDDDPAAARRRFFLDPWGSPYWLYVDFSRRRVLLYSVGPDRRRDTEVSRQVQPLGDDLGVMIGWPEGAVRLQLESAGASAADAGTPP